eukprot:TRINITY_DN11458_c0_g1_i1.p1 TRINITY_DN11458_c0_g1~~TRINITY_DN11458_c0_g1_i1.p1  ORF type:complete len:182 (+),score=12.46 TRINITY_DN11458_c0_g1_i1:99-644(+)
MQSLLRIAATCAQSRRVTTINNIRISHCLRPFRRWNSTLDDLNLLVADEKKVFVNGYDGEGFCVNNTLYPGSLILLPSAVMLWDAKTVSDINIDSLALLEVIHPTPSIVLVGCGDGMVWLPPTIVNHFRQRGIVLETMNSRNAASTFNFLNQEDRAVVAVMLPPGVRLPKTPTSAGVPATR